jgi:serine/threonine protein kinase
MLQKLREFFSNRGRVDLDKRFLKIARVGQGSMSKLFKARDLKTGLVVALKILDKGKTDRLMQKLYGGKKRPPEGEIAVALRHPNIVRTYEHGVATTGEQFLVMEFVEGVGLNFLVETNDPFLNGRRIDLLTQAAEGLAYMHQAGYIHRDICPRNMLVDREGTVKLIDFGLSVPNTPEFRQPGNRTGTPHYMAPELIRREPTDERIDIFSFGVTAYEVLTGHLPWEAPDTLQVMLAHLNTPPKDPRVYRPDLDDETVRLIYRMLATDPKKRMGSMKEVVAALKELPRKDY